MQFKIRLYLALGGVLVAFLLVFRLSEKDPGRSVGRAATGEELPSAPRVSRPENSGDPQRLRIDSSGALQTGVVERSAEEIVAPVELQLLGTQPLEFGDDDHDHTLGRWLASISPAPRSWSMSEGGFEASLTLPDGESVQLKFDREERYGTRKGLFAGRVLGKAFSETLVSYVGDAIAGVIRMPDQGVSWEMRYKGNQVIELEKVDLSRLRQCAGCKLPR